MKITRPPHVRAGAPTGKASPSAPAKGKAFTDKLAAAERPQPATAPAPTVGTRGASALAEVSAALEAGRLSAKAAVDKVVEVVLDRQLGPSASPALRAQLAQALHESLTDDPLLAAKLRSLGE